MNKLKAVTSVLALVILTSCSKGDETNQATMNVQAAKSAAKEIPYKSEIERGLTLQFDYINIPQGEIGITADLNGDNHCDMKGTDNQKLNVPVNYDKSFLFSFAQKQGLVTVMEKPVKVNMVDWNYGEKLYDVRWTPKANSMRDEKNSDIHWLRIPLGACKVQTVVKDIEYHNPNLSQTDDFRLVMGTYEDKPTDFGKSQEVTGGAVFGAFKFRVLIKLNPFNQTYSYVTGDIGKIDADGWQSQNIPQ